MRASACGTAGEVRVLREQGAGSRCEGGTALPKNRDLTVLGRQPRGAIWRAKVSEIPETQFIASASVGDAPNLAHLVRFESELERRYPQSKRLPSMLLSDLIESFHEQRGRVFVRRLLSY